MSDVKKKGLKSAYELAMERLQDDGEDEVTLTEVQKEKIREVREYYKAKTAERGILYKSEVQRLRVTVKPEDISRKQHELTESYQSELLRWQREEEEKIEQIRKQT